MGWWNALPARSVRSYHRGAMKSQFRSAAAIERAYRLAQERYAAFGVNRESVLPQLKKVPG